MNYGYRHDHYAPQRHDLEYVVSLDLGQARDFTALSIIERVKTLTLTDASVTPITTVKYRLRNLERVPLGTRYPEIVARTLTVLGRPPFTRDTPLVIDRTGVGRAVGDLFQDAGLEPYFITVHGGDEVNRDGRHLRVPKRELVGALIAMWQSDDFEYEKNLALVPVMERELTNFHMKISVKSGHDSYEAWREKEHDDLVLSLAQAAWFWLKEAPNHEPMSQTTIDLLQNLNNPDFYLQ
jgi:hypothetical protein